MEVTTNDIRIGAAYIRVSTAEQTELSPDSQLKLILEYAKNNNIILDMANVYSDEGISGRKAEKRPGFMNMIMAAKSKPTPFDVILVWKFSRFARNREESVVYKSMLRKQCGIDVISISEPTGEDKTSILIEALLEAMDEYYSLNLSEEVHRGMIEKASRGGIIVPPPMGYVTKNGIYAIEPNEAEIIRMIFSKYLLGQHKRAIADELNTIGAKTQRGKQFTSQYITYILSNPTYTGKIRYTDGDIIRGCIVQGAHEPIISDDVFERVQEKIKQERQKYPKNYNHRKEEFYFRGIIRCSNCGGTLTRAGIGRLQCYKYAQGNCNVSHYVKTDYLKEMVIKSLQEISNPKTKIPYIKQPEPLIQSKIQNNVLINSKIKKERAKLERIKSAYENGIDTIDEYKENKSKILQNIANLQAVLDNECKESKSKSEQKKAIEDFKNKIAKIIPIIADPNTPPDIFNSILYDIIDNIVYSKPNNELTVNYKRF